jgi:calcineurin-like phosphoesterase family protein
MKYYISDLHLGHKNILSFDNRPYFSVEGMNQDLIKRWNSVVTDNDDVFSLGDMFWKNDLIDEILPKLKGNIHLITGNHDRINAILKKRCVSIKDCDEIEDGDNHVILSHYPSPCFKNHYYGWIMLYGHVHSSFEWNMMEHLREEMTALYNVPCRMYNVGCMISYMDYTPRTLEEILKANENK